MPISFKIGLFGSWVGIPLGKVGVSGGIIIRARIIRLRSRLFMLKEGRNWKDSQCSWYVEPPIYPAMYAHLYHRTNDQLGCTDLWDRFRVPYFDDRSSYRKPATGGIAASSPTPSTLPQQRTVPPPPPLPLVMSQGQRNSS